MIIVSYRIFLVIYFFQINKRENQYFKCINLRFIFKQLYANKHIYVFSLITEVTYGVIRKK